MKFKVAKENGVEVELRLTQDHFGEAVFLEAKWGDYVQTLMTFHDGNFIRCMQAPENRHRIPGIFFDSEGRICEKE